MDGKNKQKVDIETSFVSYLTGHATTRETIALDDRVWALSFSIDWPKFRDNAIAILNSFGSKYYIKEDMHKAV